MPKMVDLDSFYTSQVIAASNSVFQLAQCNEWSIWPMMEKVLVSGGFETVFGLKFAPGDLFKCVFCGKWLR